MNPNITLALLNSFVGAVLYTFIGLSLGKKTFAQGADFNAWRAFRVWWFGMAVRTATTGLSMFLLAAGASSVPLHLVIDLIGAFGAAAALWGLLSYLVYVYTGKPRATLWLGIFYALFFIGIAVAIFSYQPVAVRMEDWNTAFTYQTAPGIAFTLSLLVLISFPPIIAAVGFFRLFFRVKERSQKYRALMVPLGILTLFGIPYILPLVSFLIFKFPITQEAWWPISIRLLGILALVVIYWAYFPPGFLQKRFGITAVTS
jgi:hypothetical protein